MLANYQAPSELNWSGRLDNTALERFFQVIQLINLNSAHTCVEKYGFALIGFACDEGIRRNLGRPGAAMGPEAFRKIFGNLAIPVLNPSSSRKFNLYDLGDIICIHKNLESAQESLSKIVSWTLENQLTPIIIGGGHEVSLGGYLGVATNLDASANTIGIINFDAHFDLRPIESNKAHSGNSFSHIAKLCEKNNCDFSYLVLGVQPAANTSSLYAQAQKLGVSYIEAEALVTNTEQAHIILEKFLNQQSHIYLSLCMDVFAHAFAPGVSAPQSLGLWPPQVQILINQIIDSGKLTCFDIAEYSPPLDSHSQTGKLCAAIVHAVLARMLAHS